MGMDGIELVLAIESAFGISIPDEEASRISTVGEMYQSILGKLSGEDSKVCLTSSAFYRTRKAIMELTPLNRRQLRPSTAVSDVFPEENRRAIWRELEKNLELKLPQLHYPVRLVGFLGIVSVMLPFAVWFLTPLRGNWNWLGPLLVLGLFVLWPIAIVLCSPLRTELPSECGTVGGLVEGILAKNFSKIAADRKQWNEREVWEALCRVITEQTGAKRRDIRPDARFVKDLGID